ncbi:MAG: hypothetical protein ACI8UP_005518 [Porticoccaceae bacterium]
MIVRKLGIFTVPAAIAVVRAARTATTHCDWSGSAESYYRLAILCSLLRYRLSFVESSEAALRVVD